MERWVLLHTKSAVAMPSFRDANSGFRDFSCPLRTCGLQRQIVAKTWSSVAPQVLYMQVVVTDGVAAGTIRRQTSKACFSMNS
jgi:hypothetical protein